MMIISHRGNLDGPDLFNENRPEILDYCISKDIPIEVDLRWHNDQFYFGHDEPQYPVTVQYLLENKDWLWIHCKEKESFQEILKLKRFNCFWHQKDDYTMTSFGYIWAYPGQLPVGPMTIGVMPELKWSLEESLKKGFFGLCTDNVIPLQEIINSK